MTSIVDLDLPMNDAISYNDTNKLEEFLDHYNVTSALVKLERNSTYYIIGEKGTGKTAIGLYYTRKTNPNKSKMLPLSETFYERFVALKNDGKIKYSNYNAIWRCILLVTFCRMIVESTSPILRSTPRCINLKKAIKFFKNNSQRPELEVLYEYMNSIVMKAGGSNGAVGLSAEVLDTMKQSAKDIHLGLKHVEESLRKAVSQYRCKESYILLIDGIDARPRELSSREYIKCLSSLTDAAHQLNTEFFKNCNKHKNKFRIVSLTRPDVFVNLNVYNGNNVVIDNSVVLSWETTSFDFLNSPLYKTIDKYFYAQNGGDKSLGWRHYFRNSSGTKDIVFVELLNRTLMRPRDFFTAIKYLIEQYIASEKKDATQFQVKDIVNNRAFQRYLSDYMLGEIRNYANFYMSNADFNEYILFFQYLNSRSIFSWRDYLDAYSLFKRNADKVEIENREFYSSPEALIQFFYDVNIIGYQIYIGRGRVRNHFAYRDRTINDISPRIKIRTKKYVVAKSIRRALHL